MNNGKTRQTRVMHVTLGLEVGGLEKLLAELARHTDRKRFALHFVTLGFRGPVGREIEALGWPVTALDQGPGLRPAMVLRLAGLFRQWKPDIVHTHDIKPLLYASPATRMARVPGMVHTTHCGRMDLSPRQHLLGGLAARLIDRFVCVSQDGAQEAAGLGVKPEQLQVIHNGIDLTRFASRGPNLAGPIVTVSRLSPEKDVETLLRAARLAVDRCPGFRLVIAGDGPCRAALEELCRELSLQGNVEFLGQVTEIPALLGRSRFMALSSFREGISLTLLEAMASGLPVVATNVGGNPEVVVDKETGLLVPPQDPAALARAMLFLLESDEDCRRLGLAARQRAQQHFDICGMVAAYQQLYCQVLREKASKTAQQLIAI